MDVNKTALFRLQIPGSSEKRELVKNDIIYLPLKALSDKFLQSMSGKEEAKNWKAID